MKLIRFCSRICVLFVFACCSVKEDRTVCPCRLFLDMSEVDKDIIEYASIFLTDSDGFVFNDLVIGQSLGEEYYVDVPHACIDVWVSYGAGDVAVGQDGLIVDSGDEFPEIYMHHSSVNAVEYSLKERIILNKEYCNITLCLSTNGEFPYRLEMKGNVNGYCADGTLSRGDFSYQMKLDDKGECEVSVPRQYDNSLRLEVCDDTGVLRVFALGEYISASGYDWSAQNLRDLTVSLDYSLTNVSFVVEGWDNEYYYKVVI